MISFCKKETIFRFIHSRTEDLNVTYRRNKDISWIVNQGVVAWTMSTRQISVFLIYTDVIVKPVAVVV